MKKILVYHDMGAPSHYRALLKSIEGKPIELEFAEFSFIKAAAKAILKRDWKPLERSWRNFKTFVQLSLGIKRPDTIILGIAPFDWRILVLAPILWLNHVQLHTSWPYWDGSFNAMKPRLPGVIAFWRLALRKRIKHVYFVTQAARENFLKAGFHLNGSSIVHHSISTEIYKNAGSRSPEKKKVGYVGRLETSKGILEFIQIAKALHGTRFEFVVAGSGAQLEAVKQAESEGLIQYVGHLSSQAALAKLYNQLDFLLLPSQRTFQWEELFGMVIIESAACGVFSITTDHIGPREIIGHMNCGLIFPEKTFTANTISYLENLDTLPNTEMISNQARGFYSEEFLSTQWAHSH